MHVPEHARLVRSELVDNARSTASSRIRAAQPVKSGPAAMFPGAPETTSDIALGTGFLVESQGVYVLIERARRGRLAGPARRARRRHVEVPARRDRPRDVRLDLALLALVPPAGSPVVVARLRGLPLGDSNDVRVGEWLVVLGDAFGDEVTASAGIVSATGRTSDGEALLATGARTMGFHTFLQPDARITRGNSGGPVIDTAGQVVGLAVATSDRPGEISFAVPSNRIKEVIGACCATPATSRTRGSARSRTRASARIKRRRSACRRRRAR